MDEVLSTLGLGYPAQGSAPPLKKESRPEADDKPHYLGPFGPGVLTELFKNVKRLSIWRRPCLDMD